MKLIFNLLLAVHLAAADWPVPVNVPVHPLAGCDYTLTNEAGTFTSPLFPSNYANNLNCSWLIFVGPGKQVLLEFESFLLELGKDFVKVHDGPSAAYPLLLNATGYSIPQSVVSSANAMLVRLVTNPTVQYAGFRAHYQPTVTTTTVPPLPVCGGELLGSGSIDPPKDATDPAKYANNVTCLWHLQSSQPSAITLTFTKFKTEAKADTVKIWEGVTSAGNPAVSYSGDQTATLPVYTSSKTNKLTVEFHSDETINDIGFHADF